MSAVGHVRMVDVSAKPCSVRMAVARAEVIANRDTLAAIREGRLAKGDCLAAAKLAGIQAAKRTFEFLPLCHPVQLTHVEIEIELLEDSIAIQSTVKATDRTGVEMEALVAVAASALTIYDMAKSIDRGIEIRRLYLVKKSGGRSGTWAREPTA